MRLTSVQRRSYGLVVLNPITRNVRDGLAVLKERLSGLRHFEHDWSGSSLCVYALAGFLTGRTGLTSQFARSWICQWEAGHPAPHQGATMNSSTFASQSTRPITSKLENENDDPVGDPVANQSPGDARTGDDASDESNSGAERTGNDGKRRSTQEDTEGKPQELPEGSDVPPDDDATARPVPDAAGQARRGISDAELPQSARG